MRVALLLVATLVLALPAAAQTDEKEKKPDPQEVEIAKLIEQLGNRSWKLREKAQAALLEIGEPAIPQLKKAAGSEDLERRWRARKVLVKLGALLDPKVLKKVRDLLAITVDSTKHVNKRTQAQKQIIALGDKALSAFFHILVEKDYRMRRHVTEMASGFLNKQVVPLLLKALNDGDKFVVSGAASSLRKVTGQKFASYEKDEWLKWWKANRKTWKPGQKKKDPPKKDPPKKDPPKKQGK